MHVAKTSYIVTMQPKSVGMLTTEVKQKWMYTHNKMVLAIINQSSTNKIFENNDCWI